MKNPFRSGPRSSGIVAHVPSLAGPYGCGDIGESAARFADFLSRAGQSWWQILPLGPAGEGNSPYSTFSAFAGSPILISLAWLVEDGLLRRGRIPTCAGGLEARVNYPSVWRHRQPLLQQAHAGFLAGRGRGLRSPYDAFCAAESGWLDDFALFCALRERQRFRPWTSWPGELRLRRPAAIRAARQSLRERIDYHRFLQFLFARQWRRLRAHCARAGVAIIGDVPIFVSHDSADVWAHPHLFLLERDGRPQVLSGVPPDHFNRDGQLWGHPLYAWPAHRAERFRWWGDRFAQAAAMFDAVRIDHFLGFHRLWAVPRRASTARRGSWLPTPGRELLSAIIAKLGKVGLIAEDLGHVTPEAFELRDGFRIPGMRVLQCGFGGDGPGSRFHQPHNYPPDSVAYTATHDFETTVGWYRELGRHDRRRGPVDGLTARERVRSYLGAFRGDPRWPLIRSVLASASKIALFPVQDLLGLDNGHRLNLPGRARGNWQWRVPAKALSASIGRAMRTLCRAFERCD